MADPHADPHQTIVVTTTPELAEIVADRMWQWGVQAVSETAVDKEQGVVEISTSVGNDRGAIDRALATLDPAWAAEVRGVDATVAEVAPEFLSPTWYAPGCVSIPSPIHATAIEDVPDDVLVTVIDSGSAFGLGDHPTTRTSMTLLQSMLTREPTPVRPRHLLDVGCGTGALAVLAAQLGVPRIRAIDIADAAVEATSRNMELNDVGGRIDVDTTPIADIDGSYDVIMANILAPVLVSMADDLKRLLAPGGSLVISGILEDRHDHVLAALAPLTAVESLAMDGWITIRLRDDS